MEKVMKKLINRILNSHHNEKVRSVLADGAYDSNENFKFLRDKRIKPIIKVKMNSIISSKNSKAGNKDTEQQTKDFLKWKKKRRYGQRWMAETVFSSFKRMFGEHASASKFQNMIKEMMIKVSLYNLFTRLA